MTAAPPCLFLRSIWRCSFNSSKKLSHPVGVAVVVVIVVGEQEDADVVGIDGTGGIDFDGNASIGSGMGVTCGIDGVDCARTLSVQR